MGKFKDATAYWLFDPELIGLRFLVLLACITIQLEALFRRQQTEEMHRMAATLQRVEALLSGSEIVPAVSTGSPGHLATSEGQKQQAPRTLHTRRDFQ